RRWPGDEDASQLLIGEDGRVLPCGHDGLAAVPTRAAGIVPRQREERRPEPDEELEWQRSVVEQRDRVVAQKGGVLERLPVVYDLQVCEAEPEARHGLRAVELHSQPIHAGGVDGAEVP